MQFNVQPRTWSIFFFEKNLPLGTEQVYDPGKLQENGVGGGLKRKLPFLNRAHTPHTQLEKNKGGEVQSAD